jgi:hypothetical protein
MKRHSQLPLLVIFIFLTCSCASVVPRVDCNAAVVIQDPTYALDVQAIEASQLNSQQKITARAQLISYYEFKKRLNAIIKANDDTLTHNISLNNGYSTVDAVVGGVGGISALATIIASWSVVVPVASGVWNLIGLAVQKFNVTPQINLGSSLEKQYKDLLPDFAEIHTSFRNCVTATTASDAATLYREWGSKLDDSIRSANSAFGCAIVAVK